MDNNDELLHPDYEQVEAHTLIEREKSNERRISRIREQLSQKKVI